MRAVTLPSFGGPEVLTLAELPDPVAGPGVVVLDVAATAVNRADVMQRLGFYPPPPGFSEVPGLECSGTVAAVGSGVSGWQVGDQACALLTAGGYATKVSVPVGQLLPIPQGVPLVEAAALPEVTCTVHSNVFLRAGLSAGDVFLVHGGSSGIGTMAIQLAVQAGATVITTVGSAEKAERVLELGATRAVLYKDEDFVPAVKELGGADVILDVVGAKYLDQNVKALADGGRLVVIGLLGGAKAELNLGALLAKRGSVHATALRSRPAADKAAIVAATREHVWPLIERDLVAPVIDRWMPLEDVAEAHRLMESSAHIGKILLTVGDAVARSHPGTAIAL
jgi:putative PIG3 family NAD(P)H quinone oxidoreductase